MRLACGGEGEIKRKTKIIDLTERPSKDTSLFYTQKNRTLTHAHTKAEHNGQQQIHIAIYVHLSVRN